MADMVGLSSVTRYAKLTQSDASLVIDQSAELPRTGRLGVVHDGTDRDDDRPKPLKRQGTRVLDGTRRHGRMASSSPPSDT